MTLPDEQPPAVRIAVIEDSEAVRRSLEMLLRAKGFSVIAFDSAETFLADSEAQTADCFLVDYKLPEMDGVDLMLRLKERGVTAPALMITGCLNTDIAGKARSAGYHGILEKPMPHRALLDTIRRLLRDTPSAGTA